MATMTAIAERMKVARFAPDDAAAILRTQTEKDLRAAGAGVELLGNRVLAAKYMRPEKTKGGILLTDKSKDEDKWQGKVGMIVAMGPSAFVEDGEKWFGGKSFAVGDWIMYRNSAGTDMKMNGVECKQLGDADIIGRIDDPMRIW